MMGANLRFMSLLLARMDVNRGWGVTPMLLFLKVLGSNLGPGDLLSRGENSMLCLSLWRVKHWERLSNRQLNRILQFPFQFVIHYNPLSH